MKTVGELKKFLEGIPDDTLLVIYKSNMEKSGFENNVFFREQNMSAVQRTAWDRFDNIDYEYTVFENDDSGAPCLQVF